MLFGFAFMASFLGKLAELVPRTKKASWTERMLERLEPQESKGDEDRPEEAAAGDEVVEVVDPNGSAVSS